MRTSRRLSSVFAAIALLATGCSGGAKIDESKLSPKNQSTKILAADGSLITTLKQEENREVIPLRRIPKMVRNAVIAIEDVRFYSHRGIDGKAILRALVADAKSGKVVQGGSTITQQLVRTAISEVGRQNTLHRKLREAVYAYRADSAHSKDKILELYLNTVYFGEGAYGIQTASQNYFHKDVEELALAEAALLAGIIKSPIGYSPRTNSEPALQRRNLVLERMKIAGLADSRDVAAAQKLPLSVQEPKEDRYPAAYFIDYVTRLIQRSDNFSALGETEQERGDMLFRRGLRVHTTMNRRMQNAAEAAITKVLDQPGDPSAALVAIDPKNGYVRAVAGGRDYFAAAEQDPCATLGAINADGSPKLCAKVNLALGQGGGGSGRQGGSSFKPFVLAAALQNGIKVNDVFAAPSCIDIPEADAGGTKPWHVCNYEDEGAGAVTVSEGTYRSINTVYAQMIAAIGGNKIGPKIRGKGSGLARAEAGGNEVVDTARKMGICKATTPLLVNGSQCHLSPVASAALGTNPVSVLDMTSAFTTFPNLGIYRPPVVVSKITDATGKVLWQAEHSEEEAIPPAVAHVSTTVLQDVIKKGTGARNGKIGRPAFGKTGTAQEWRDAWFVGGAGTDLVAGVSVFWPDGEIEMKPSCIARPYRITNDAAGNPIAIPPKCRPTRIRVAGGTWPTEIWREFMVAALQGVPVSKFPVYSGEEVKKLMGGGAYRCLGVNSGTTASAKITDEETMNAPTDAAGCGSRQPSASVNPAAEEAAKEAEELLEEARDLTRDEERAARKLQRKLEDEAEERLKEQLKQQEELEEQMEEDSG